MSSGSYRSSGNWGTKAVQFTLQDAERIAAAVQSSERGRRGRKPSTLPRAAGGGGQASGGGVTFATFGGSWFKGTYKTITLLPGTATASAYNSLSNIAGTGAGRNCTVSVFPGPGPSGEEDEYRLVSAECS
jgi:hypothetical protein